jgi:ArsR family transcriptional regulator, zinc-responsive transcriptional repressor
VAKQIAGEPTRKQFAVAVELLQAVGVEPRLRILWALLHSERSVNELADHLGANGPAVSQHLARLRELGLVATRRQGNFIFYACDHPHVRAVVSEALSHAQQSPKRAKKPKRSGKPAKPTPAPTARRAKT